MISEHQLPPAFSLREIAADDDPLERARSDALERVEDGAFYLAGRPDRVRLSAVVVPEASLSRSLPVLIVAMGAMGDALGVVIPPAIPVNFGWPDQLYIDGASAGSMRAAADLAHAGAPQWIVMAFDIAIIGPAAFGAGEGMDHTTLAEQGAGHITPPELASAFARYFLIWVRRWQDDGFSPVRENWNARVLSAESRIDQSARPKKGPSLRSFIGAQK